MAHDPKLEIYKLKLSNKQDGRDIIFRELFRNKYSSQYKSLELPIKQKDILKIFFEDFIKSIDDKGYYNNDKRKKGFTLAKNKIGDKIQTQISYSTEDGIITGTLDGGIHGRKRFLGEMSDTSQRTNIGTNHIVGDRFYFLIYAPLDHSEAILMIHGYTEIKISDVFRDFLVDYFKYAKQFNSKAEIFVPKSLKEAYLKQATFKSIQFTSDWILKSDNSGEIYQEASELQIKIEIIDKSEKKKKYNNVQNIINKINKSIFKEGEKEKALGEFKEKKAKMISNGKEQPIHFDDEDNIKPIILLSDQGIIIDESGEVPNFDQLNTYCRNLLDKIIQEVMPSYAVRDL